MTNIFLQDTIYVTVNEYVSSSTCKLNELSDEQIQIYIVRAESLISQKVCVDGSVPNQIKQATVMLVDRLYMLDNMKEKEVIEEKDENHTRKYKINKTTDIFTDEISILIKPFLKVKGGAKLYRT